MKEALRQLVAGSGDALQRRNLTREYLQARILTALQEAGAMVPLVFHGGTALRFLYLLPRYSEDLDFSLEANHDYDLRRFLRLIARDLAAQGYRTDVKLSDQRIVHSAFVSFPGLLHDLGLSPRTTENLSVKIEVDTRPPANAGIETTVVRRHTLLHLQHHDRASLLAGKVNALLQRPYLKGRDVYDLVWYLGAADWPEPNLIYLNNGLQQTGWKNEPLTTDSWRGALHARLVDADWSRVISDVRPFLADPREAELLVQNHVLALVAR